MTESPTEIETTQAQQPAPAETKPAAPTRAPRNLQAAHAVLERLFQLYPKMFGAKFLPLKLGAFQDIMARHPDDFAKEDLKVALGLHARSTRYLESVAAGNPRHDLDGNPLEPVAPEHVHHAIGEIFRRKSGRNLEEAQAWRKKRLVAAITASGLSREDYEARAGIKDEAAQAAVDEAFAEIAERAARHEALKRAFAASGQTVEQFAEMYGMKVGAVREALGPDAASRPASDPDPTPAST
ncbi:MAG: ProQ/FINO family protein [Pseudomonadota bacterium]